MKTLEDTNQLDFLNQCLPMRKYNKFFPYRGPHQHEDDSLDTFFSSVKSHDSNTSLEIIVGTKTLLTDVYAIVSK